MPDISPSLLIAREATLDGEVLLNFTRPERWHRFDALADVRKYIEGSVLIATPDLAREALRQVFARLGPGDEVAVVAADGRALIPRPETEV